MVVVNTNSIVESSSAIQIATATIEGSKIKQEGTSLSESLTSSSSSSSSKLQKTTAITLSSSKSSSSSSSSTTSTSRTNTKTPKKPKTTKSTTKTKATTRTGFSEISSILPSNLPLNSSQSKNNLVEINKYDTIITPKTLYRKWFDDISEPVRFLVSGNIGTLFFLLIEKCIHSILSQFVSSRGNNDIGNNGNNNNYYISKIIHKFIKSNIDGISFFYAYVLQIATQHYLHALLVYGLSTINTKQKYIKTLKGQYSAYIFSLIGSTILNVQLLKLKFSKTIAFGLTMLIFAILNYYVVGYVTKKALNDNKVVKETIIS